MKKRITFLAIVLTFTAVFPLFAAESGTLSLSSGPVPANPSSLDAFLSNAPEITAALSIPLKEKAKVEFRWVDPSGGVYSNTSKLMFPGKTQSILKDRVEIAGKPASGRLGWWRVEAVLSGEILSKKFFLTDNRQVPAFFYGNKQKKLEILTGLDSAKHGVQEITEAALLDGDEEVRASAIGAVKDIKEAWAPAALERSMDDPASGVRSKAFEALLGRGGDAAGRAAEKAASDASPVVRALTAEKSPAALGAKSSKIMGMLIKDPDAGVRDAALASLAAVDGGWATGALAEGLKSDDPVFRKRVLNAVAFKKGEVADALSEGLKDPEPAIRAASLNYLAGKGLATPGALRPLTDDPVEDIAISALKELAALKDMEGVGYAVRSRHSRVRLQAVKLLFDDPAGNAAALSEAVKDEDREIRKEAVRVLVKAGGAGTAGLIAALGDRDEDIRLDAAFALLQSKANEAEAAMLAALDDPSERVRLHALRYFISRGGPGLPAVLEKTACAQAGEVRTEALAMLVNIPGEEASGALATFLACGDANTKNTVVDALAARKDAKAEEALMSALKDKDAGIRFKAASLLLASGSAAPLSGLLEDPDPSVRRLALGAVQAAPGPALVPALSNLSKDPDPGTRLSVLEAVKMMPGEAAASIIAALVDDKSCRVKARARELVLARQEDAAVDVLLMIAAGGEPEEKKKAMNALGSIKGGRVEEALARLVSIGGPEEKIFAINSLAGEKSPLFKEAVRAAIQDPDGRIRSFAIEKLGSLSDDSAREIYIEALSSKFFEVKRAGIAGLRGSKDKESVPALRSVLNDPSSELKREALSGLIKAGDTSYATELPRLILDPDPDLRRAAYGAALSLPDRKLKADALVAAAGGPYPDLSQVAVTALAPLGDPRALPYLVKHIEAGYSSEEMLAGIIIVPGAGAIPSLEKAYRLSGANEARKLKIIRSLDGRGPASLTLMDAAMKDGAQSVRLEAAGILARRWKEYGREWEDALGAAVKHEDFLVRKTALDAVLKAETPVVLRYAVPALADKELIEVVLAGLKERREPEVIPAVFEQAKGLKDADARAGAIDFLNRRGLDALLAASVFSGDPSEKVRAEVIKSLADANGPEAVLWLLRMGGRENGPLREKAWDGIKGRDGIEIGRGIDLFSAGGSDASAGAAFLSARLTDPGLLEQLIQKSAKYPDSLKSALMPIIERHAAYDAPALVEGMGSADKQLGDSAARAVSLIEGQEGVSALSQAFRRYPASRVMLIKFVAGTTKVKELMEAALKDPDPAVRREAAGSLKDLTGPGTAELLLLALACPEDGIRLAAAEAALAGNYRKPLAAAAEDKSPAVRARAASGLRNFPEETAALKALALDRDTEVSGKALDSLKLMEEEVPSAVWAEIGRMTERKDAKLSALETLTKRKEVSQAAGVFAYLLEDADGEVSEKAESGLMALGAGALPEVHPLLKKKKLVPAVLRILRKTADLSSEPYILKALSGIEGPMLMLAIKTLEKTGADASEKYLEGLYHTGGMEEKVAAVKAIGGLRLSGRTDDAARVLTDALSSKEDYLRFYAAYSIGRLKLEGMKGLLAKAAEVERTKIVKAEMERVLGKL